ncbi:MFS transporter [Sphingobacterium faecium NBRC 15299]|uniref:MFS transporter n=1 Tax=Sphingobacterium faecium TaxID=34087 RepID=UPI000D3C634B|nr:MFS transporter [Sphingobacterium faecium]PTX13542.1 GPH family glycoside/pentoside/hexuronide:cation symporter [Sphingobacterium faecium]GEM65122.1 MFS transporter [Sphingobacterium faecium NBRC 15299]
MMKTEKLSFKEKVGYGFGDFASSIFWKIFSVYLLYYYTDVFGISAAVVGTMFLITRIWDTAFDPLVGIISDRTHTKWGKFRPFILWIALPFGLIGILTFSAPELSQSGKIIYAYCTYTLMMMIYSLINVPYASLMGVMTADIKERTALSSYRFVFAFAGSILVLGLAEPLVDYFGKVQNGLFDAQRGWQYTMIIFACIASVLFYFTFAWTRERILPVKSTDNSLRDDLRDLATNKPWFILLAAGIATLIFNSLRDGSAIFYFKYYFTNQNAVHIPFLNLHLNYSTLYLVLGQGANIIGVLLVKPVADRLGKKKTFASAMILAGILSLFFYSLDETQVAYIFILQCLISICAGAIFPLLWSMYGDIADYSEWKTGRRATGLIFSSSSMSQKLGWTMGGALTGWILAIYGFEANAIQTDSAKNGIRLMMSIIPAIGALISVIFIYFYSLTDAKMYAISEELEKRRNHH